jgi:hypothetical protein
LYEKPIAAQILDTNDRIVLTIYSVGHMAYFHYPETLSVHVTEFGKTVTRAELDRAIAARELQKRLGYASQQAVKTMLSRESIISNVRQRDVAFANDVLGNDLVTLKANQPRKKVRLERITAESADLTEVNQIAHADVFECMGKAWVIVVHEPMHLICADNLPSDKQFTQQEIIKCLTNIKGVVEQSGFKVLETHFDSAAKTGDLSQYPDIVIHPPGQHVARAERAIRTMKEQLRAFVQAVPFLPWFGRFALQAVAAATMYISQRHARNSKSMKSPFQQFTGRTPVIDRDFKAVFGDLVAVENTSEEDRKSLVNRERVKEAVWLRPAFDDHGSAMVLILDSGQIVKRTLVKHIGWEDNQQQLNKLWSWSGSPREDSELKQVQFTENGKVYDLRVMPPDPDAEVEWEKDPTVETQTVIGRTRGGFPIPTRQESGVDVPNVSSVIDPQFEQQLAGKPQLEQRLAGMNPPQEDELADMEVQLERHETTGDDSQLERQLAGKPQLELQLAGKPQLEPQLAGKPQLEPQLAGKPQLERQLAGKPQLERQLAGKPQLERQLAGKPQLERQLAGKPQLERQLAGKPQQEQEPAEKSPQLEQDELAEGVKKRKRKLAAKTRVKEGDSLQPIVSDSVGLKPSSAYAQEEGDSPDTLVLDVSERGRVRRRTFKLMATEVGKPIEAVTTVIAKGMRQVAKLKPDMRKRADGAIVKEIRNLISDHGALSGVYQDDIKPEDEVLPCNVFVEDKMVNGIHVKDRARIVAGGHRQDKSEYVNLSTQTVNTESVFILLAIAALEKRSLMVIDVRGAYLNADMKSPGGRCTYIIVDAELAKLFILVDPALEKFIARDGRLRLRLDKALYGCIQSSHLWQEMLTETLKQMGFRISEYDKCVAVSADGNVVICFHVDDLMVIGKTEKDCETFRAAFEKKFTVTSSSGVEVDYLGIHIQVKPEGIALSQFAMVNKLVQKVKGSQNSPAATAESEELIPEEERVELNKPLSPDEAAEYRSTTAVALYLSKRTRPDLLLAVNRLCRHAQAPTVGDGLALRRLLRYVSKTRRAELLLPATSLQVEAHIDASFASDRTDRKSTTGAIVMVGGAIVWAKSGKQSIVTKSSFEAELVALSDMASMVLWVSMFMKDLGFDCGVPIIYQDNMSTMKVAEKGLTNNPNTKHIDIRHLWITEVIKNKAIKLQYKKTDEMIADGMTKPLVGEKFYRFVRDLNIV